MTLTTTDIHQTTLDILFELIQRKSAHIKEWRAIEKLEAIYSSELHSIKSQLHTTAMGETLLIGNMTDDHLLNTVKWMLRYNQWEYSAIPKSYMDEIKKRPNLLNQLIDYDPVIIRDDACDYFI